MTSHNTSYLGLRLVPLWSCTVEVAWNEFMLAGRRRWLFINVSDYNVYSLLARRRRRLLFINVSGLTN